MEVIHLNSSILRRLALLQHIADKNKPAQVTVHFTNGTATVTTPGEALSLFVERGPSGVVDRIETDHPIFGPWAALLTGILHPVADRRIEDFV